MFLVRFCSFDLRNPTVLKLMMMMMMMMMMMTMITMLVFAGESSRTACVDCRPEAT
jgi:hypothetical protein